MPDIQTSSGGEGNADAAGIHSHEQHHSESKEGVSNNGECRQCELLKARIDELIPFVGSDIEMAKLRRLKVMVADYLKHGKTSFMDLVKYMRETF